MRIAAQALTIPIAALAIGIAAGPVLVRAQSGMPVRIAEAESKGGQPSKSRPATPAAKKPAAKKPAVKKAPAKKPATTSKEKRETAKSVAASYAAMPPAQRAAIQFDLNWTGHYSGLASGDFSDRSIDAVRAFQKDHGTEPTGVLTDAERAALSEAARARRERAGWRMIEDRATGAQVGLPGKLAPRESKGRSGTHWQSAQGQLQIETFRIREPGATLATVLADQKKEPPNRQIGSSVMRDNHFVLTGIQGLKRFLVTAEIRDLEIRGISVLYDQGIENAVSHVGYAVLSAFGAFPGSGVMALIAPPAPGRIEYGTGIVVTADGHVLTDSRLAAGCSMLEVAGQGDAARLAEQDGMTLLRVFGASPLTPAALIHPGIQLSALTLAGIAQPQAQDGRREATTTTARLGGDGLDPAPPLGFAGAIALDSQGRIAGMVSLKAPVLTAAGAVSVPPATLVPIASIREFLDAQSVKGSSGPAGVAAALASVVRVICVRR